MLFYLFITKDAEITHLEPLLKRYRVINSSKNSFLNVLSFRVVVFEHQLDKSNAKLFNSYTKNYWV